MTHKKATTSQILPGAPDKPQYPELANAIGEFRMINKAELEIDHSYQRDPRSDAALEQMAKNWHWAACPTLMVCERNNRRFVFDGQNRKLAADLRPDIKALPCLVFKLESRQEEAKAFLVGNAQRVGVPSVNKYRAGLVAKDDLCIFLNRLITGSGMTVGPTGSPKVIACINTCMRFARQDRVRFEKMWPLFTDIHQGTEIFGDVVKGCWYAETRIVNSSNGRNSLLMDPARSKLVRLGGRAILEQIRRTSVEKSMHGPHAFCEGVMVALKKKI